MDLISNLGAIIHLNRSTRLRLAIILPAFLLTLSCSKTLEIKPVRSENAHRQGWTQFGGDVTRTSFRESELEPPLKSLWVYKASSAVGRTLLAAGERLYLSTLDGKFEIIDIKTGKRLLRRKCPGAYEATSALYQNKLILASRYGDKTLALYDLKSGKYLWRINAGDIASEPLIAHGAIYVSALYQHVDKYEIETGIKLWTFKTGGQLRSSPALSGDLIVTGCDNGSIYALTAKIGELRWEFQTGASVFATPVIAGETVYVGSLDSTFYALHLQSGQLKWKFFASRPLFEGAATNGDLVVFGASDGHLYALDATTGRERWRFRAGSSISTQPLIAGSLVYFGSLDSHYYCVDLETGELRWRFRTEGRVRTAPVIWGPYLFGASEDRFLYAFGPANAVETASRGL